VNRDPGWISYCFFLSRFWYMVPLVLDRCRRNCPLMSGESEGRGLLTILFGMLVICDNSMRVNMKLECYESDQSGQQAEFGAGFGGCLDLEFYHQKYKDRLDIPYSDFFILAVWFILLVRMDCPSTVMFCMDYIIWWVISAPASGSSVSCEFAGANNFSPVNSLW